MNWEFGSMIRTFSIVSAVVVALALPVFAESASKAPAGTEAETPLRGNLFTQEQARTHLAHLGYSDISELTKDENGVWRGSATKNGKDLTVAVDLKGSVIRN
jgi:putative membrane protein